MTEILFVYFSLQCFCIHCQKCLYIVFICVGVLSRSRDTVAPVHIAEFSTLGFVRKQTF